MRLQIADGWVYIQGLLCGGGRHNACGRRHLPPAGQPSATSFIKSVNLDPLGSSHWHCSDAAEYPGLSSSSSSSSSSVVASRLNSYTFAGSYYHVYVKLADCPPPTGDDDDHSPSCMLSDFFVWFISRLHKEAYMYMKQAYKSTHKSHVELVSWMFAIYTVIKPTLNSARRVL